MASKTSTDSTQSLPSARLFVSGNTTGIFGTITTGAQKRKGPLEPPKISKKRRTVPRDSQPSIEKLLKSYRTSHRELLGTLIALEENNCDSFALERIAIIKQGLRQVRVDLAVLRANTKEPPTGTQASNPNSTSNQANNTNNNRTSDQGTTPSENLTSDDPAYCLSTEAVAQETKSRTFSGKVFWSHKLYRNSANQEPSVKYCTTKSQADEELSYFFKDHVVGIDIEYVSHKKPTCIKEHTSLIQVANENRIVLLHIARFNGSTNLELLPKNLAKLLEDHRIIKTGVSILSDCTRIENQFGIVTNSICEISHYHKLIRYFQKPIEHAAVLNNKRSISLETQVEEHFKLPMFKEDWIRRSRWDLILSETQMKYAATDAYASFQLFQILERKRKELDPVPPRPMFSEYQTIPKTILLGAGLTIDEINSSTGMDPFANDSTNDNETLESSQLVDTVTGNTTNVNTNLLQRNEPGLSAVDVIEPSQKTPGVLFPAPEINIQPLVAPQLQPIPQTSAQPPSSNSNSPGPRHFEMVVAAAWAKDKRKIIVQSECGFKVKELNLQAYYLWYERKMDLDTITKIWRNPPISPKTVACHVEKAVHWGKLPHDIEQYRELIQLIPKAWRVSLDDDDDDDDDDSDA